MRLWALASCGTLVAFAACTAKESLSDKATPNVDSDNEANADVDAEKFSTPEVNRDNATPETSRDIIQSKLNELRAQGEASFQPDPAFSSSVRRSSSSQVRNSTLNSDREAIRRRVAELAQRARQDRQTALSIASQNSSARANQDSRSTAQRNSAGYQVTSIPRPPSVAPRLQPQSAALNPQAANAAQRQSAAQPGVAAQSGGNPAPGTMQSQNQSLTAPMNPTLSAPSHMGVSGGNATGTKVPVSPSPTLHGSQAAVGNPVSTQALQHVQPHFRFDGSTSVQLELAHSTQQPQFSSELGRTHQHLLQGALSVNAPLISSSDQNAPLAQQIPESSASSSLPLPATATSAVPQLQINPESLAQLPTSASDFTGDLLPDAGSLSFEASLDMTIPMAHSKAMQCSSLPVVRRIESAPSEQTFWQKMSFLFDGKRKALENEFTELEVSAPDLIELEGTELALGVAISPAAQDKALTKAVTCFGGTRPFAQRIPEAAAAGTPMPGRVESPTQYSPATGVEFPGNAPRPAAIAGP